MALSWNEIKDRAVRFSKEWENDFNEDAEAKSFMDDFYNVFGVPRRRVASFEMHVKKEGGKQGFIDLLWKGVILIEFKSRGKDLNKAHTQAKDYFPGLKDAELPKYILVSDFENFRLYDLEENSTLEFKLENLVNYVQHFGFIAGYQKQIYKEQDPVNVKAAELMGRLHDRLEDIGYEGHSLEVYLVRLLFCLFAEDTTIFQLQEFQNYIEQRTNTDGSDLAAKLQELFQVLNTPREKRFKNLDEQLNSFPYVNGKLFEEPLPIASFDSKMRQALLDCCYLNWSKISPAIFGSMFQSVMNPQERRNLGAHYTSEKNILKLIKPLFLDDLWKEFESVKHSGKKLPEFHKKLSKLKFLDPACGCGNFLVITYRELRLLEIEILRAMNKTGQGFLDVREIIWLDVDMMYGIEYEEFPARIAEVAMWLMDHQMNMLISNEFGQYFARLPLKKAATIVHGNALRVDWEDVVAKNELSYIIGNPPFIGKSLMSSEQKVDMSNIFIDIKGAGVLDYVAAWYLKAAIYLKGSNVKVAFVSTNSIVQGEQTAILWGTLFKNHGVRIHFAHRTFSWRNEARGNAAVHVVIIGFSTQEISNKVIYEYEDIKGEPHEIKAKNINAYLIDARDSFIYKTRNPISNVLPMNYGSMPNDGGFLLLDTHEYSNIVNNYPQSAPLFKRFVMGEELIRNIPRYCLWLVNINPGIIKSIQPVIKRIESVKNIRLKSTRPKTRELGLIPTLFGEIRQPEESYIAIPRVSSSNRDYIPISILSNDIIAGDKVYTIATSSLFYFGTLMSKMHMSWMRHTSGRLKSDYSYSNSISYNNYPWPENPSNKHVKAIEKAAQKVLDVREQFSGSSLADLYHPLTMPPALVKAHNELDRAVDLAYRPQPFISEAKRMEYLFELYEKYTSNLFTETKKSRKTKKQ